MLPARPRSPFFPAAMSIPNCFRGWWLKANVVPGHHQRVRPEAAGPARAVLDQGYGFWTCRMRGNPGMTKASALSARAGQKTTDLRRSVRVHVGPDNGGPVFVWFGHQRVFRNRDPFAVQPHAISAILGIPIHVLDFETVREGTAQAFPA